MTEPRPATWRDIRLTMVTPCFLGQPAAPGSQPLPVQSIRGVLRYWFRALCGAYIGDDLRTLARIETAVFGAAVGDINVPSQILVRGTTSISYRNATDVRDWWPGDSSERNNVRYLLGQGLYDQRNRRLARPYVAPGTVIGLRIKNLAGSAHWTLVEAALWALVTFGGLGARARRGFGTLKLTDIELPDVPGWLHADSHLALPTVLTAVSGALGELTIPPVPPDPEQRPRYPRFHDADPPLWHVAGDVPLRGRDHISRALAATGEHLRLFRLGNYGPWDDLDSSEDPEGSRRAEGTRRSSPDYPTQIKPYLDRGEKPTAPVNATAVGLPVMYSDPVPESLGPGRRSATIEPILPSPRAAVPPTAPLSGPNPLVLGRRRQGRQNASPPTLLRRASPLWLRIHPSNDGWHLRSLVFFSELLPPGAELQIRDTTDIARIPGHVQRQTQPVPQLSEQTVDRILERWFEDPDQELDPGI